MVVKMFRRKQFEITMRPEYGKESKVLVLNNKLYCKSINTYLKLRFMYNEVTLNKLEVGESIRCLRNYRIFVYEKVRTTFFKETWMEYGIAVSIKRTR